MATLSGLFLSGCEKPFEANGSRDAITFGENKELNHQKHVFYQAA